MNDLTKKIVGLLDSGKGGATPEAGRLAAEHSRRCEAANRRLTDCAALLDAKQVLDAVALAEVQPPLLAEAEGLGFERFDEWRELRAAQGLPVAELPAPAQLERLRGACQMAADPDWLKQVAASGSRKDKMAALRRLAKATPGDSSYAAQLAVLAPERFKEIKYDAKSAILGRDQAALEAMERELAQPGWEDVADPKVIGKIRQTLAEWRREALSGQTAAALEALRAGRQAGDVEAVQAELNTWSELELDLDFQAEPGWLEEVATIREWVAGGGDKPVAQVEALPSASPKPKLVEFKLQASSGEAVPLVSSPPQSKLSIAGMKREEIRPQEEERQPEVPPIKLVVPNEEEASQDGAKPKLALWAAVIGGMVVVLLAALFLMPSKKSAAVEAVAAESHAPTASNATVVGTAAKDSTRAEIPAEQAAPLPSSATADTTVKDAAQVESSKPVVAAEGDTKEAEAKPTPGEKTHSTEKAEEKEKPVDGWEDEEDGKKEAAAPASGDKGAAQENVQPQGGDWLKAMEKEGFWAHFLEACEFLVRQGDNTGACPRALKPIDGAQAVRFVLANGREVEAASWIKTQVKILYEASDDKASEFGACTGVPFELVEGGVVFNSIKSSRTQKGGSLDGAAGFEFVAGKPAFVFTLEPASTALQPWFQSPSSDALKYWAQIAKRAKRAVVAVKFMGETYPLLSKKTAMACAGMLRDNTTVPRLVRMWSAEGLLFAFPLTSAEQIFCDVISPELSPVKGAKRWQLVLTGKDKAVGCLYVDKEYSELVKTADELRRAIPNNRVRYNGYGSSYVPSEYYEMKRRLNNVETAIEEKRHAVDNKVTKAKLTVDFGGYFSKVLFLGSAITGDK